MTADREQAFNDACRLVKAWGSSPWRDWQFTLRLADWLLGDQVAPAEPPHRSIGKVYEPNGWGDCEACGRPWPCPQARIDYIGTVGITPPHAVNAAPQVAPTEPCKHCTISGPDDTEAVCVRCGATIGLAPQVAPEPDDEWVHDLPALGEDD